MTLGWTKQPTTREVYAVLRASHPELVAFTSFSDPTGTSFGGPGDRGTMETEWGFQRAQTPILGARTTWEIDPARPHARVSEETSFWLCLAKESD